MFVVLFFSAASFAADPPLSRDELERFIKDTPVFMNELKMSQQDDRLTELFLRPEKVNEDATVVGKLEELSWNPGRYAYVFSRVVMAGYLRDMSRPTVRTLEFMKEQLGKWKASDEPEPLKSRMIEDLTEYIREIEEFDARAKDITRLELLLMWEYQDELNEVLLGKLPIRGKKMKVLR
jgi:hypothetical protein